MKKLACLALAIFVGCSGCATVSHAKAKNAPLDDAFIVNFEMVPNKEVKKDTGNSKELGKYVWFYLTDEVSAETTQPLIKAIEDANKDKELRSIVLEMNTPGGSVDEGFLLSKAIEDSKVPVICVGDGLVASMGTFLMESCATRVVTKRTSWMMHSPSISGLVHGDPETFESIHDALEVAWLAMLEQISFRSNIPVWELKQKTSGERQWWMGHKELMDRKLVDRVINRPAELR